MPSPFPGMDPFIEGQEWPDFHHEMISAIRAVLTPSLLPHYRVRVEESVYLVPAPGEGDPPRSDWIILDVCVVETQGSVPRTSRGGTATVVAVEPVTLTLPALVERRQAYLRVLYRETREVVTVVELLSPTNKDMRGPGLGQYLLKREKVLQSPANLVELDLLRGGTRLAAREPLPAGDYYAFVIRASARPQMEAYSWTLRHPLPPIPIPLANHEAELLDLQAAFTAVYDRAAYAYALDYRLPVEPSLSDADTAWVQEVLSPSPTPDVGDAA